MSPIDVSSEEPFAAAGELRFALQSVLNLAASYSKEPTSEMLARDSATRRCSELLKGALGEIAPILGAVQTDFRVQPGGRQSNYSPVPWVRIYSKRFAPTAMEGNYLVYLFAADGSRVYLSLNQGTSEFRSGAMRPINNRAVLRTRAAEARRLLEGIDSSALMYGSIAIDLSWKSLNSVGAESRRRIRNYEDGNIIAHEYRSGQIPSDSRLMEHLTGMVPLLSELYGSDIKNHFLSHPKPVARGLPSKANITISRIQRTQGRLLDSVTRRAIETYAEDQAISHFESRGWTVQRVGHLRRGYDLDCIDAEGRHLHVEVKGTSTLGEEVILTPNEVRHAQYADLCGAQHALFVVSEIHVDRSGESPRCSGGVTNNQFPWILDHAALTPTQYAYRVTRSSGD